MPIQRKLAYITVVYWIMLLYVIAALVWWFIALNQQSSEMAALRVAQVASNDPAYQEKMNEALAFKKRKNAQYTGEGLIFLLVIMVGAVFVYRATRKQLQLVRQQQNFLMAVTHELKTPISVTKLNLETLQFRKLDESKQKKLIQSAIFETERLNDLTNNILLASRIDGGETVDFSQNVALDKLVSDVVRQFESRYPERKISLTHEGHFLIAGDELLLRILLSNLLDNALKYTPPGSMVEVKLGGAGKYVTMEVADTGTGIGDEEKKKVFEKFYRVGGEETRSTKGTGLGLYLCRKIATAHKGSIQLLDNKPQGAVFLVKLPVWNG
ncbi:MAG: HAMP domain-containing histidine kinase [Chitinophagaceae bacterium]|jgi:signal transduction histidine kinase|nr:HAMP domain-containing histidine kinase [Chitinophagaceae bacterium]